MTNPKPQTLNPERERREQTHPKPQTLNPERERSEQNLTTND
ncbi:MAG TPA: hypothetical protein VLN72_01675 [Gillisia sp.]|nr:hypothetical protein [Gillisia sp.]